MSLLAQLAIAGLIFLAGSAAGIKWQLGVQARAELEAQQASARTAVRRADQVDQAATRHEAAKVQIETVFETITKEVQHVVEKPVYRNLCFDDDGMRVLRAAVAGRPDPSASQPAPAVPASGVP